MIRRPPRSTQSRSSAASDVYKRQVRNEPSYALGYQDNPAVGPVEGVLLNLDRKAAGPYVFRLRLGHLRNRRPGACDRSPLLFGRLAARFDTHEVLSLIHIS